MFKNILERLEAEKENYREYRDGKLTYEITSAVKAIDLCKEIVQEAAKEYGTASDNDLTVVSALPSLYPLQPFEEEAIHKVVKSVKDGGWIPCSERLPECCGYPVLLTVENAFGQRSVCKAFTNYMKEGKLLFYTNEKEYCSELTSSKLSDAWKPIAWAALPTTYQKDKQKKYCFACDYWLSGVCVNGDSEHCADFRYPDDSCEHWKQKGE